MSFLYSVKTLGIAYSLAIAETILAPVTPSNTARGGELFTQLCVRSRIVLGQRLKMEPQVR